MTRGGFFFFCFWQFEYKGINAVFEFWPGKGCKKKKTRGRGVDLVLFRFVFFCPVELGSLELTGAQPFFWFFSSLRSMFWCFFKRGCFQKRSLSLRVFVCMGWKPLYFFFPCLFSEWGGFAHFKTGSGCKYLSLAQWIKDAFCPVGVTICLTRWINYCTSKQRERRKKEMQKLNMLSEAGICLVVIGCFASAGDVWCTVRHCLLTH